LTILPVLMQLVQTRMRLLPPSTLALTGCRLTFQRRRVVLWACEMLLPNCGPLPQRSHFCAMTCSNFKSRGRRTSREQAVYEDKGCGSGGPERMNRRPIRIKSCQGHVCITFIPSSGRKGYKAGSRDPRAAATARLIEVDACVGVGGRDKLKGRASLLGPCSHLHSCNETFGYAGPLFCPSCLWRARAKGISTTAAACADASCDRHARR